MKYQNKSAGGISIVFNCHTDKSKYYTYDAKRTRTHNNWVVYPSCRPSSCWCCCSVFWYFTFGQKTPKTFPCNHKPGALQMLQKLLPPSWMIREMARKWFADAVFFTTKISRQKFTEVVVPWGDSMKLNRNSLLTLGLLVLIGILRAFNHPFAYH